MTHKSTLSPESAAIIEHIKAHGPCSITGLLTAFPQFNRVLLQKRLANLVALGWLEKTNVCAGVRGWALRASARSAAATVSATPISAHARDTAGSLAGAVAEPRRVNYHECGAYVPGPGPALRPGALDHQRYASLGNRC